MAQLDTKFTAYFIDATTAPWTPLTGLSATITIREADSPYTVVVNDEAMTEVWGGHYIYNFASMNIAKDYVYSCDPNSSLSYIQSWVTDKRINNLDQNISDIRSWGWFRSTVNLSWVTSSINNLSKKIDELMQKEIDFTDMYTKLDDAISKIDSIEIPDVEEKEAKKAVELLDSVAEELKTYIQSQSKKEAEIMAITSELNKLDMEDAMEEKKKQMEHKKEMERKMKEEEEENKKMIELLNAEFDKLEEEDRIEKKKELEKELEEMDKEMKEIEMEKKEIQKELKSL